MKKVADWLWSNVLLPLLTVLGIGTLASQALEKWLRQQGYLDHPEALIAVVVAWLGDQSKTWWLLPAGAVLLLAPGMSWAYRKYTAWAEKREENRQQLGRTMISMASQIRIAQGGFRNQWPGNINHLRGAIEAIFARAGSLSLSSPPDSVFAANGPEKLLEYFDVIAAHLRQGNFSVAKKRSRVLSA
jgi:hypothetical protein